MKITKVKRTCNNNFIFETFSLMSESTNLLARKKNQRKLWAENVEERTEKGNFWKDRKKGSDIYEKENILS